MVILRGKTPHPEFGQKRTRYINPAFQCTVFKHTGESIVTSIAEIYPQRGMRVSPDITNIRTTKSISNPQGTYTVTFLPRRMDYFKAIDPGDWVLMEVDNGDGGGWRPLMYGPIMDVRLRRATIDRGAVQKLVVVSGTDFGRALAMTTALNDAKLAGDPAFTNLGLAKVASKLKTSGGTPGEMVKTIVEIFLESLDQWNDPRIGYTFGIGTLDYDYIETELPGNAVIEPIMLAGNLWQLLQTWANVGMNELFVDYRPPRTKPDDLVNLSPAVVLRQYPFYGDAWDNLTAVAVDRDEIVNDDWGKSDSDVKNWLRAIDEPRLTGVPQGIAVYLEKAGTFNRQSIKKFGYRRHEIPTQYIYSPSPGVPKSFQDILQTFSGYLTLWHHSNEKLYNGSMDLYFRPDARVGYRLDYYDRGLDDRKQAYIETVSHSLNFPGKSTTTLTFTRGRDVGDIRFTGDLSYLKAQGIVEDLGDVISRVGDALKGDIEIEMGELEVK